MPYLADPGGQFASDTHRRVLGHLTLPSDNYGWTVLALLNRMVPDVGTKIYSRDEMQTVLDELVRDGLAENVGNVYRMTPSGFDLLTGPIADEPEPGAELRGPASINAASAIDNPTTISQESVDAANHSS